MESAWRTPPVVLDTNVVVAGACRRKGSRAYRLIMGVLEDEVPCVLTPGIALEYQDVLLRPRVLELTGLDHKQSVELVTVLIMKSRQVHLSFEWRPNLQDETDNKFIEAAVHAAGIVVTYNMRDFSRPDMRQHGWSVMTPDDFLVRYLV